MEIDQNNASGLAQPLNLGQDGMERILQRRHESAALQIDDSDGRKAAAAKDHAPLPWRAGRIIQRTHEPRFVLQ